MKRKNYIKTVIVALTVLLASAATADAQTVAVRTLKPGSGAAVTLEPNNRYNIKKSGAQVVLLTPGNVILGTYTGATRFVPSERSISITNPSSTLYTYAGATVDVAYTTTPDGLDVTTSIEPSMPKSGSKYFLKEYTQYKAPSHIENYKTEAKITAAIGGGAAERTVRVSCFTFIEAENGNGWYNGGGPNNWIRTVAGVTATFRPYYAANVLQWGKVMRNGSQSDFTLIPNTTNVYRLESGDPSVIEISVVGGEYKLTIKKSGMEIPIRIYSKADNGLLWTMHFTVTY